MQSDRYHTDFLETLTQSQRAEANEDNSSNDSVNSTMGEIIAKRLGRRDFLKGALAVSVMSASVSPLALMSASEAHAQAPSTVKSAFDFIEPENGVDDKHHIAPGYDADVLIRWGDAVMPGAPAFEPQKQTPAAQKLQFGYNNDYLGYIPMPGAANPSHHGLLVVNHEYTNEELMFPGMTPQQGKGAFAQMTKELVDIEMAAHGGSVLEIVKQDGKWKVVEGSKYNRRIDASTAMDITGPAAGHQRMKTGGDPTGSKVLGMINNCAGGTTPWGTWLTCEENFNGYFWGKADGHPEAAALKRYGAPANGYAWGKFHERFDIAKEPNEVNRFGWIVEIDPLNPASVPKKRTALGRFKHEGAKGVVNRDGRYVVYQGDDQRFDYVYKFVTDGKVDPANRAANMDLLDKGVLYVAKYNADGGGEWLPLVHGQGPLTAANGFNSQADVVIEARRAGDLLGATKMDRPEGIDVSKTTGKVYLMLTNNTNRKAGQEDAANPRPVNAFGHIIEMIQPENDHADTKFRWEILVRCGDPAVATVGATFNPATSKNGWFGMPDMVVMDNRGRLWVGTDGMHDNNTGRTDGLYAVDVEGPARGTSKLFFRCPAGAELCGPEVTPDDETMFVAIQHPGDDGHRWKAFGRLSTFDDPSTRWPDFKPGMPPRPSVVAITKSGGGKIA